MRNEVERRNKIFRINSLIFQHIGKFRSAIAVCLRIDRKLQRLIAAKTLIAEGKNLEDVSRAVGFMDYSSFYRAFKKEFGITPRQYTQL